MLSVGYSTCHWCHVMEQESFEDVEIATYLNQHFISMKVDREERPDIDDIYMRSVNLLSGRGGWPMTVMLLPDGQAFFGGTYFPPRDRWGMAGFLSLLQKITQHYAKNRERLIEDAQKLSRAVEQISRPRRPGDIPDKIVISKGVNHLLEQYDEKWGGFSMAPKFPQPYGISFLFRYFQRTGHQRAKEAAINTLYKMAEGGIHDQLAGGFHRYSTDQEWLVPHFEKMLYDNAQLINVYLDAYQVTSDSLFRNVAQKTLDYLVREMRSEEGGFFSATDADSDSIEGKKQEGYFFTWTPQEIDSALDSDSAKLVKALYGVTDAGNFEGRNILHLSGRMERVKQEFGLSHDELEQCLIKAHNSLYEIRARRPGPIRDEKILTSWNALTISAFSRGAFILDKPHYLTIAIQAADFLLKKLHDPEHGLYRSYLDGQVRYRAYSEDYAFFISALLDLYESSFDIRWLKEALGLQRYLDAHFWDTEQGGYFMVSDDHEKMLTRDKPIYDGAIPSSNSVATMNLLRLYHYTSNQEYLASAERIFRIFAFEIDQGLLSCMLEAVDFYYQATAEIVIIKPEGSRGFGEMIDQLRGIYLPNRILSVHSQEEVKALSDILPLLQGKVTLNNQVTAFLCKRGRCESPIIDPKQFKERICYTDTGAE